MTGRPESFIAGPGGRVSGEIRVPGDKSISHRAVMLGSIASGISEVHGFLEGEDCLATIAAFEAMGVRIERPAAGQSDHPRRGSARTASATRGAGSWQLRHRHAATGRHSVRPEVQFDADRRSLADATPDGVASARRCDAWVHEVRTRDGRPPIEITGGRTLQGVRIDLDVPSAQVKSAILLAGLYAEGRTLVVEPAPSRDHTERMLAAFGVAVERDGAEVSIRGQAMPKGCPIDVPGDFSSAAFFIVAALIAGASPVLIRSVGVNPTRTGLLDILRLMGADIRVQGMKDCGGEPVADLEVMPGMLRGIAVPHELVARSIDEFPVLFAAAAVAEGETIVTGAGELRVKESDRIAVMAEGLGRVGVQVEVLPDGMRIHGGTVAGGVVESHGDHRIAMSFAVLASRATAPIVVRRRASCRYFVPGFRGNGARRRIAAGGGGLNMVPVIAIDGPGGSGKGTVARLVAREFGWHLLDSGALYRLVALAGMRNGLAADDSGRPCPARSEPRRTIRGRFRGRRKGAAGRVGCDPGIARRSRPARRLPGSRPGLKCDQPCWGASARLHGPPASWPTDATWDRSFFATPGSRSS